MNVKPHHDNVRPQRRRSFRQDMRVPVTCSSRSLSRSFECSWEEAVGVIATSAPGRLVARTTRDCVGVAAMEDGVLIVD